MLMIIDARQLVYDIQLVILTRLLDKKLVQELQVECLHLRKHLQ